MGGEVGGAQRQAWMLAKALPTPALTILNQPRLCCAECRGPVPWTIMSSLRYEQPVSHSEASAQHGWRWGPMASLAAGPCA